MLPSLLAPSRRRSGILGLAAAAAMLGAAAPCWAQTDATTKAAVVIVESPTSQIAADFVSKSGVALSVMAPKSGGSSLTVAVATVPQQTGLAVQSRLLTVMAGNFRSLIPLGAVVSILDSRLLYDYADIAGADNVVLVLLQYN